MTSASTRILVGSGLAATLVLALTAVRPSPQAQAPADGTVALTGARIIDGTGRTPSEQGTIVINNGRITAVGGANVQVPAGARRVDVSGKTIVPGFINAHAHLNVERGATMPVRDDLIRRLKTYAMYGVTAGVNLGSQPADEAEGFALMREQERPGLDRARIYSAGINAVGKTPDEARKSVDRLADLKAHSIKFHINGNAQDMDRPTWSAIIDQAHKRGLRASVHIFYLKDAKAAIDAGVDILAHSIRDQDVPADFVAEMKRKNVSYVPTLTRDLSVFVYETTPAFFKEPFFQRGISLYKEQVDQLSDPANQTKVKNDANAQSIKKALDQANRNVKLLSDGGVTIAMGTDSGAQGNPGRWQGYFEHVEMEMMVKAGMTPMQTIVASTANAARIHKLDQIGTLEAGKWADFVVLDANPLQDIRNTRRINAVWIAGRQLQN